MALDTMPKSVAKWHSRKLSMICLSDKEDLSADVMPGLNTTVPESNESDGRTNGALMSENLRSEK